MSVTAKCLINTKYADSSLATEYSTPADTRTIIDKFSACNSSGSTRTIDIHIVPSGDAADASNKIVSAFSLTAGLSTELSEMKNQILEKGDLISIVASAATSVVVRMSGREVT